MKYGKAAGIVAITTDLPEVLVCADNEALLEASCELFNRALATSRCLRRDAPTTGKTIASFRCSRLYYRMTASGDLSGSSSGTSSTRPRLRIRPTQ